LKAFGCFDDFSVAGVGCDAPFDSCHYYCLLNYLAFGI
jgi:hypothetical protein